MRFIAAALTLVAVLCSNVSAQAEKRIFVIANDPDGYGVDRCLATGARCGAAVATAYCRSREFTQAASFRRVEREEITGTIPVGVAIHRPLIGVDPVAGRRVVPQRLPETHRNVSGPSGYRTVAWRTMPNSLWPWPTEARSL